MGTETDTDTGAGTGQFEIPAQGIPYMILIIQYIPYIVLFHILCFTKLKNSSPMCQHACADSPAPARRSHVMKDTELEKL